MPRSLVLCVLSSLRRGRRSALIIMREVWRICVALLVLFAAAAPAEEAVKPDPARAYS